MSILVSRETRVLVQGITGRSGALQTKVMKDSGSKVVAGVTPGKGGTQVEGIHVYDFIHEAMEKTPVDAVISFVPPRFAKDASIEVIDNGIKLLVLTTEEIPEQDVMEIVAYARAKGTTILGPGTPGLFAPGKCKLGAHPSRMFKEGRVGMVSKSGALSYEVGKNLVEAGIGQSTVVGLGGGPIWGISQTEILKLFQNDPETDIIVLLGEIGGNMEQEAAAFIKRNVTKPVVGMIVGRAAPKGKSLGHAGAIIQGNKGTAQSKMEVLGDAGVYIAKTSREVVKIILGLRGEDIGCLC